MQSAAKNGGKNRSERKKIGLASDSFVSEARKQRPWPMRKPGNGKKSNDGKMGWSKSDLSNSILYSIASVRTLETRTY